MTGAAVIRQARLAARLRAASPARQRLIALAALGGLILSLIAAGVLYGVLLSGLHHETGALRRQAATLTRIATSAPPSAPVSAVAALDGETPAQATAQLEAHVKGLAARSSLTLVTIEPVVADRVLQETMLRVHLRGSYDTFARFALSLRTGQPTSVIRTAEIQPSREAGIFDIRLSVAGFREVTS